MKNKKKAVPAAISLLFFAAAFLFGEHHFSEDWYSYYSLSVIREPGYALFVRVSLELFGEQGGIHFIALIQNLLAAFSVFACASAAADLCPDPALSGFKLRGAPAAGQPGSDADRPSAGCASGGIPAQKAAAASAMEVRTGTAKAEPGLFSGLVCALLLLLPHLATPLASNTHLVLTDTVMAEGICLSLFYLYMIPMTRLAFSSENRGRNGIRAFLLALLMCQFRGQMMVCFILTALVLLVRFFPKHRVGKTKSPPTRLRQPAHGVSRDNTLRGLCDKKEMALSLAGAALFFVLNSLIGGTWQYLVNGYFTGKTLGPANMACNMIYLSGEEAAESIKDPGLKALFTRMRTLALEKQLHISLAPEGIIPGEAHYAACHDRINYEVFEPLTQEFLAENGTDISDYALYRIKADEVGAALFKSLLFSEFGTWFSLYLKICAVGFIRTVAVVHPVLNWYTVLVYGLSLLLTGRFLLKRIALREAGYMLMVLTSIIGTVCSTSLIIECWARYVFYNMPFFYYGLFLLLRRHFTIAADPQARQA